MRFLGRSTELDYLKTFVNSEKSQFMYVRGRRRVGKSLLLQNFRRNTPNCFYFTGTIDSSDIGLRQDFAESWDQFSGKKRLSELKKSALTWSRIFQEITGYALLNDIPTVLLFDEIQWIARTGSGFIGRLKEAWLEWEQTQRIKVVICGSSSKFFETHVGGEERILRGLSTYATLWVKPFALSEVKKFYFPDWLDAEVCLVYMMLGGIPYYLERLDADLGFVHAVNEALFTSKTIFLEEVDEILKLEFNEGGRRNVAKILESVGQDGKTQDVLVKQTGLPQSTVAGLLEKLSEYRIIFEKYPVNTPPRKQREGIRYYMKDFFLNFFFQVLDPLKRRIGSNVNALLFPCAALKSSKGYYIENFSGKAFELLVRYILEERSLKEEIFKKLLLKDPDYSVGTFWNQESQIDLIVEHPRDRIFRVIECKWASSPSIPLSWIEETVNKKYAPPQNFLRKNYLVISQHSRSSFLEKAHKEKVGVVELKDLFL